MTDAHTNKQILSFSNIPKIRQQVIQLLSFSNHSNETIRNKIEYSDTWWLLGTQGCHLCDKAERTLEAFNKVYPIDYVTIDIIDLDDSLMTQFSPYIPILLSPSRYVYGSFSVVDLQKLV